MNPVRLPSELRLLWDRKSIARRVRALAGELRRRLRPKDHPLAVVVLHGGFVFAADVVRHLPPELGLELAFVRCSSYGAGTVSQGRVRLLLDLDPGLSLRGRTVVLLDDILDTGRTLGFLQRRLRRRGAERILTCVLLRRKHGPDGRPQADWVGFEVDREFVVGYGLDYSGRYRHLPVLTALRQPGLDTADAK